MFSRALLKGFMNPLRVWEYKKSFSSASKSSDESPPVSNDGFKSTDKNDTSVCECKETVKILEDSGFNSDDQEITMGSWDDTSMVEDPDIVWPSDGEDDESSPASSSATSSASNCTHNQNDGSSTYPATSSASNRNPIRNDGSSTSQTTNVSRLEDWRRKEGFMCGWERMVGGDGTSKRAQEEKDRRDRQALLTCQTEQDALELISEGSDDPSPTRNIALGCMVKEARQTRENIRLICVKEQGRGEQDKRESHAPSSTRNIALGNMVKKARQARSIPIRPTREILERLQEKKELSDGRKKERQDLKDQVNYEMNFTPVNKGGFFFIYYLVGSSAIGHLILETVKYELENKPDFRNFFEKHFLTRLTIRHGETLKPQYLFELFLKRLYRKDVNESQILYLYEDICAENIGAFVRIVSNW